MKILFPITALCAALSLSTTAMVAVAANAEQATGLRIFPPTRTELFTGQRFDLRVESQIPAREAPKLVSLKVNETSMTEAFNQRLARQGEGSESGTPSSKLLFGASARNLSFDQPGHYIVEATVLIDGVERQIKNEYHVASAPNPNDPDAARKLVFFWCI
jgi:hypothetical protein